VQNDLHKLFDEIVWLMQNEKLRAAMRENLARVDELNDTSRIVDDLNNVAKRVGEQ
jgi:hypothetical protein